MKTALVLALALSTDVAFHKAYAAPNLIGGTPTTAYPEAVYISMGGGRCSATVVGAHAVITAAHCIGNGERATFKLNGKTYQGTGTQAPLYRSKDQDVAMIYVAEDILASGVKPATIKGGVKKGETVRLSGYGCVRNGGGGGNDGVFRQGDAKVVDFTMNFDFVTKGSAALCFGDSGGPVWKYSKEGSNEAADRVLVGINSKGDIRTTSYLSDLARKETTDWIASWAKAKGADVCGVTVVCGVDPEPETECEKAWADTKECWEAQDSSEPCEVSYLTVGECLFQ